MTRTIAVALPGSPQPALYRAWLPLATDLDALCVAIVAALRAELPATPAAVDAVVCRVMEGAQ